jgi:hypothetical protein
VIQKGVSASEKGDSSDKDELANEARQLVLGEIKEAEHKIVEPEESLSDARDNMDNWIEGEQTTADEFQELRMKRIHPGVKYYEDQCF